MRPVFRLLLAAAALVACAPPAPSHGMSGGARAEGTLPAVVPLRTPAGHTFQAELMIQPPDRAMGLMFRPSLPEDRVLVFVFDRLDFHGIWMKNCKFPIDVVWLDEERKVVDVAEKVPPCRADPCPSYDPMRRALYFVEMNAGQAKREGYALGATVEFTLPR